MRVNTRAPVLLTFDGELEFVAWKVSVSKDGGISVTYGGVQEQCVLPWVGQILCQR